MMIGFERIASEIDLMRVQQADEIDHAGEHAGRISAAAEAEQIDAIAFAIVTAQEAIGREHIAIETIAGHHLEDRRRLSPPLPPGPRHCDRADSGMIISDLPLALLGNLVELEDIRKPGADLIVGAVEAQDEVAPLGVGLCHLPPP